MATINLLQPVSPLYPINTDIIEANFDELNMKKIEEAPINWSNYVRKDWAWNILSAWSWDVLWPASSTDWVPALFDWVTGKLLKNSTVTGTGAIVRSTSPALVAPTGIVKWDVWLWNVDNTTDLLKPISTATQDSLNLKANLASPTFTGTVGWITKAMVWLTNVDDTSDVNKPVSTAQQTALNLKANLISPTLVTPTLWVASATSITTSGNIELWHASDTTLSRVSAGKIAVEGVNVGNEGILQNSQSAAYTLVLADAWKHIYHPSADTTARTWTIPANASVAYPIGTAVTFINDTSGGVITIAITTDVMVLAGAGTTGSRTLAANGICTAVKMTETRWMVSWNWLT